MRAVAEACDGFHVFLYQTMRFNERFTFCLLFEIYNRFNRFNQRFTGGNEKRICAFTAQIRQYM